MNKIATGVVAFAFGAAAGVAVTWQLLHAKYELKIQEETIELREFYSNMKSDEPEEETDDCTVDEQEVKEYEDFVKTTNYKSYSDEKPKKGDSTARDVERPYVIYPEEFGEDESYQTISLSYYEDGVLADDIDEIMDDEIDDIVGSDFADHFGEYEDDSVFIKNDRKKCYYEILRDPRYFVDVVGNA